MASASRQRHLRGRAEVAEAGIDGEARERDQRQHEPAGEALEHHRGERPGRLAGVPGQPADPEHVATDGRGQDVGDELAGQVVRDEAGEPGGDLQCLEHLLPPQRREQDAGEGEHGGDAQPGGGAGRPLGHQLVHVERRHLRDEDDEHGGADGDAHAQRDRLLPRHRSSAESPWAPGHSLPFGPVVPLRSPPCALPAKVRRAGGGHCGRGLGHFTALVCHNPRIGCSLPDRSVGRRQA